MEKIGIGVVVFNPLDDVAHNERITMCLSSIQQAIKLSPIQTEVRILLNCSEGIGNNCLDIVQSFDFNTILYYSKNGCAHCYRTLVDKFVGRTDYVVVYADDYILPTNHLYGMLNGLKNVVPNASYIMPITTFVPQKALLADITPMSHWKAGVTGIESGVTINDVNHINDTNGRFNTFWKIEQGDWNGTNSFETTIFKTDVFKDVGNIDPTFNLILYNTDLFRRINSKHIGYISNSNFIFHYGKGGTKAVHKETGDEKYAGSSLEKDLLSDISYWNSKWNDNRSKWW